jgi:transposase
LLAAEGLTNLQIAERIKVDAQRVSRWRRRFIEEGFAGIERDRPGRGRKPTKAKANTERVVEATLHAKPPGGATHWSTRALARSLGLSRELVRRVWKAHKLRPHRVTTFKLSRDPRFVDKLVDVVGLYLNPPQNAVVLSVDEKSQCQALERTQQRRMNFDRPASISHDYRRHGTTTLFAALCVLTGLLVHRTEKRHTHVEWLRFLKQIDGAVEKHLDVHIVCDNYATHKHAKVRAWLAKHPRFHVHFTPTSASWLNMVERFFGDLTKVVRRGSFKSVSELVAKLKEACEQHNASGVKFTWTKTADEILAKLHMDRSHTGKPMMFDNSVSGH